MRIPYEYSPGVLFSEFLFGSRDEVRIEEELFHSMAEWARDGKEAYLDAYKSALRAIDQHKIAGTYEAERERLRSIIEEVDRRQRQKTLAANPHCKELLDGEPNPEHMCALENFHAGLNSSDAAQKARFEAFNEAAQMDRKSVVEAYPFLAPLERAIGKDGRPSLAVPWENYIDGLDEMRILVAGGMSENDAARRVADIEGKSSRVNRTRAFVKHYRERMALRE